MVSAHCHEKWNGDPHCGYDIGICFLQLQKKKDDFESFKEELGLDSDANEASLPDNGVLGDLKADVF